MGSNASLPIDESLFQLDLSERCYVVTGGTSGLGLYVVKQLVKQGARVVLGGRSRDALNAIKDSIDPYGSQVLTFELNLVSLHSVDEFATAVLDAVPRIDVLINNAGLFGSELTLSPDGYELTLAVCHLAHFHLTNRLLPRIHDTAVARAAGLDSTVAAVVPPTGRVVNTSSLMHSSSRGAHIAVDDLNFKTRRYTASAAYAQAKLANVVHANELSRRANTYAPSLGTHVTSPPSPHVSTGSASASPTYDPNGVIGVSVHPGFVDTGIFERMPSLFRSLMNAVKPLTGMMDSDVGALAVLRATLGPAKGGDYFSQQTMGFPSGFPCRYLNVEAANVDLSKRLWEESGRLVDAALREAKPTETRVRAVGLRYRSGRGYVEERGGWRVRLRSVLSGGVAWWGFVGFALMGVMMCFRWLGGRWETVSTPE